jgi:hypothetical protein
MAAVAATAAMKAAWQSWQVQRWQVAPTANGAGVHQSE